MVWVNTWVFFLFFFGNNWFNRTTDMGENVTPKVVFWGKNFKAVFGTPFSIEKVSSDIPFPKKWSCPLKIIFLSYFGKYCYFFWKNCYIKNIQNLISYKKFCIDFCRQTPLPLKIVMSSGKWFFTIFST